MYLQTNSIILLKVQEIGSAKLTSTNICIPIYTKRLRALFLLRKSQSTHTQNTIETYKFFCQK